MEERIPLLRGKVGSEAKGLEKRLHVLSQEWEAGRPLSKDHTPSEVCRRHATVFSSPHMARCKPTLHEIAPHEFLFRDVARPELEGEQPSCSFMGDLQRTPDRCYLSSHRVLQSGGRI